MAALNYKHLHYFWVVAKAGGIARASERLHLTPPTISGQVSLFEDMGSNLEILIQIFSHSSILGTLARKNKRLFVHGEPFFSLLPAQ